MSELRDALIEKLEDENDLLRERVRQLETELMGGNELVLPVEWCLTGKEDAMIRAMIAREVASKEFLMNFLYGDRLEPPELKIVDVFVCKIRKKLQPHGIEIHTRWGRGYGLDAATRLRFGKRASGVEHAA